MLVEFCLPIYNEEKILEDNVIHLYNYCFKQNYVFEWKIVLLNNGSRDLTEEICRGLVNKYPEKIKLETMAEPGKGRALKSYLLKSRADVLSYMDIDLAVSLENINDLIEPVISGNYDLMFGSRLLSDSRVNRSYLRSISSIFYNFLSRQILGHSYKDLQCGFKAMNKKVVNKVSPYLIDNNWFLDTELIAWADFFKFKIKEIPVAWSENRYSARKSKVKLVRDGFGFIRNLVGLRGRMANIKAER